MYRVLLVEDEEIIRKGIRYSVPWEECGCSVVGEAENGAVGEEKIAELQPDIVITDITMPVKNGLEMIADTREKFNYIAIILTGYSEFEYAQQLSGTAYRIICSNLSTWTRCVLRWRRLSALRGITSTSNSGRTRQRPSAAGQLCRH